MGNSILNNQAKSPQSSGNIVQQFNQFKQNFTGNPQNAVMNLIQQGRMTNEQFQQLAQMARQMGGLLR